MRVNQSFWSYLMQTVKLEEAQDQLEHLVDAAIKGETVVIDLGDGRSIQLVPLKQEQHIRQFGSAAGLIELSDDFDTPLDDFKDYS
jgi:antitoxin (DNA-binding transcriptional repressor) of toxin-antitoxin stability system